MKYCQISSTGKHVPPEHKQVFDLVREVYKITGGTPVDIEFAITESKGNTRIWLLQARPLIIVPKVENIDDHSKRLVMLEKHLKRAFNRQPFLVGEKTFFGVMPDWNLQK